MVVAAIPRKEGERVALGDDFANRLEQAQIRAAAIEMGKYFVDEENV